MTHRNNLDALRLLGAGLVMLGHGFVLTGREDQVPGLLGFEYIQTAGVAIFFSISGYLVCGSWDRSRDLRTYLGARALRIFPGLWGVVLVSAFVIGPIVTTVGLSAYFSDPTVWEYLRNLWLVIRFNLPGVFDQVPYVGTMNGSLWTLPVEFTCYLAVPLVFFRNRQLRIGLLVLLLGAALWMSQFPVASTILGMPLGPSAEMWAFFVAAALLRTWHRQSPGLFRADAASLMLLAAVSVSAAAPELMPWISWLFIPYVTLTVGLACTPYLNRAARFGDLSYGLYLWAFPVQQLVVSYAGGLNLALNLVLVASITTVAAWVSWQLVESPALRLKDRLFPRTRPPAPAYTRSTPSTVC